jgi:hypothetical protein
MTGDAIEFRSDDGRALIVLAYDAADSDFGHVVIHGAPTALGVTTGR